MKYSVSERSYLRTSLISEPPLRPDSRKNGQFRPVETKTDIFPTANGSANVRAADGSECVVGIKTKVFPSTSITDLIEVSVDVAGMKDNDPLPNSLASAVKSVLDASPELVKQLRLTPSYSYKLFVDIMILSYTSHPLGLTSLGVFRALQSTKLPLLLTNDVDMDSPQTEIAEVPQFDDDWGAAVDLCPPDWIPPVLLMVAVVGENVFLDPTDAEEEVAEALLCFTWKNYSISSPVRSIATESGSQRGAISSAAMLKAYDLVQAHASAVAARVA